MLTRTQFNLCRNTAKFQVVHITPKMNPGIAIWKTLKFLNQSPPVDLKTYKPKEILNWAVINWKERLVPRFKTIQI